MEIVLKVNSKRMIGIKASAASYGMLCMLQRTSFASFTEGKYLWHSTQFNFIHVQRNLFCGGRLVR